MSSAFWTPQPMSTRCAASTTSPSSVRPTCSACVRPTCKHAAVALAAIPVGWSLARLEHVASGSDPSTAARVPGPAALRRRLRRPGIGERRYDRRLDALRIARLLALGSGRCVRGPCRRRVRGHRGPRAGFARGPGRPESSLAVGAGRRGGRGGGRCGAERACLVPPPDEDSTENGGARPA